MTCDSCKKETPVHGESHGVKLCPSCWEKALQASAGAKEWKELMERLKGGK